MIRVLNIGATNVDISNYYCTFHRTILDPRVLKGYNYFVVTNDIRDLRLLIMETFTGYLDE